RGGASGLDAPDQHHQRLEPDQRRLPLHPSRRQARGRLMTEASGPDAAAAFDPLRPKLTRIAYRMLGSVADAEDVVQDAFLRWLPTDRGAVRAPEAFLRRVVTRLCLDHLKSARHRRETYIGPWLPEPLVEAAHENIQANIDDEIDDITLPLMLALE